MTRASSKWLSNWAGNGGRRGLTRRLFLASTIAPRLFAEKPEISSFDLSLLDRPETPNDLFFVRSHLGAPAVDPSTWTVEVGGLVTRPIRLTLADLDKREQATVPAVLQCAGNGRSFHTPRAAGVAWERGAVGNAVWSGVPLKALLGQAGINGKVVHVHLLGADRPPSPKTPAFLRSTAIDQSVHHISVQPCVEPQTGWTTARSHGAHFPAKDGLSSHAPSGRRHRTWEPE